MRRTRLTAVGSALGLVLAACSIQAPSIELIGEGGEAAGTEVAAGAIGTADGVAAVPGGEVAAGATGTALNGVGNAAGASCIGKATDTGVTGTEIKLGSTFAASGPVSNISAPILKGVQSYFNLVNSTGGVYGRRIKLVWYDDGWDAQRGKGLIKKLVEQDKVFVLTVAPSSNGLDAAKTYLENKRVPVFGTSGLIESQFRSSMQWPIGTSTRSATRIGLLDLKRRGVQNAAIVWLDLLAGAEARESFRDGVQRVLGLNRPEDFIVSDQRVSLSEPDFGPVWTRIQNDTRRWQSAHGKRVDGVPDWVGFLVDPTNTIKALQAAEKLNFRPKIGWGGGAPLFLDLVWQGSAYAGKTGLLAGTSFYPPIAEVVSRIPAVDTYVKTVRRFFGDSVDLNNPYLEGGYAGAALTVEILHRAGPCLTREKAIKVGDSITNYSAAGLTRPLTYRPLGVGNGHHGNLNGISVQVGRTYRWSLAGPWLTDPTPGE